MKTRKNKSLHLTDYKSNDGMLTSVWGPSLWHSLHTISFNYPNNPNMDLNPRFKNQNMKVDNLNYIMHPDNSVGVRQLNEMERNKKFESQKYYKNMLDSQMSIPSMSGMQKKGYVNPSGNMISNPCN